MPFDFNDLADYGFDFSQQGAVGFKPDAASLRSTLAADAALITAPNSGVPVELLAYLDPTVVEILTAPRRARELAPEVKKGDWTTSYAKWMLTEPVGGTQPYSDYAQGITSDVNNNWAVREQYLFQTTIKYGDLETAVSSVARVNLAAAKQKAAANIIDIDYNKFALLGVKDREIYGLLNDPNLPDSITPEAVGEGSSLLWSKKTTVQIYNDVLKLFNQLSVQSSGLIDYDSPLVLAMSPQQSTYLGSATDFNVSVLDMLRKNFRSLDIVTVPELADVNSGQTVMLFAREVSGQRTAEIGFSIKVQAGRVVPDLSSLKQKWTSSTYGGIVYMPFAFATMTGV